MEQVNTYYPITDTDLIDAQIEYKQLNIRDFAGLQARKEIIDIGVDGYLSETPWGNYINLDESNTVVINSSVGQGKSFLARQIATKYYMAKDENGVFQYTIIFAAPYKSLIGQYIDDIKADLSEGGIRGVFIPDYDNLAEYDKKSRRYINLEEKLEEASSQRLHVITTNCLLRNPGNDSVEQSFVKRTYLDEIIRRTKDESRRVVILYDEIHDTIDNFKQDLVFNLWKFKTNDILHKAFILSATFNEASKVVIKYIAELTDKKLQIIETERKQKTKDLSKLHIHLTEESTYDYEKEEFKELFKIIIKNHNTLNILSYSRQFCTDLAEGADDGYSYLRDLLISRYKSLISICIPEEYHPSVKRRNKKKIPDEISYNEAYIEGMCNIGTVFKTGISIKEQGSGYIIITPPLSAIKSLDHSSFGVFYNGIITLIQALARARYESDIYVIMPFPRQYIEEYHGYFITEDNYMSKLVDMDIFKNRLFRNFEKMYLHRYYSEQYELITSEYNKLKNFISREIKLVKKLEEKGQRVLLPELTYPTLDRFILEKGELYLFTNYAIFGRDLSAYMIWAAFNNQFVNCRLTEVSSSKAKEEIKIDNIQEFLYLEFIDSGKIDLGVSVERDIELYEKMFESLKSHYKIYVKDKNDNYSILSDSKLKKSIITFIQIFTKGNKLINETYIISLNENTMPDKEFLVEDYLLCSMTNSLIYDANKDELTDNAKDNNLIDAYQNLYKIREVFIEKIKQPLDGEIGYIYPMFKGYASNPLNNEDINLIISTFESINKDINFKIFNKNGVSLKDKDKAISTIYNILKGTFFLTEVYRPSRESRKLRIKEIIDLPKNRSGINLLYKYPYNREDNYESREDYLSVTQDEYVEGYDDEDYSIDIKFRKEAQDLLDTINLSGNDETIDSSNDNQHSDNIENTYTNQEPTDNNLKDTEEHKPDEPDNSKLTNEQPKVNDSESTSEDKGQIEKLKEGKNLEDEISQQIAIDEYNDNLLDLDRPITDEYIQEYEKRISKALDEAKRRKEEKEKDKDKNQEKDNNSENNNPEENP